MSRDNRARHVRTHSFPTRRSSDRDTGGNDSYTHVALRGDRAWFADTDGVHELDVADPTQPVQVKLTPTGHQGVQHLAATDDGRLFALGGITGVHVLSP